MKRTFFICALSALVSLSGVSATESDNNSESAVNVVSNSTNSGMSNDTISLEKYPFTSSDRQLFDLRGNVSKMVIKRLDSNSAWSDTVDRNVNGGTEYLFDKDGKLIDKPNDLGDEWKSTRSGNGRIQKREMRFEDGEGYSKKYLYNKDGMLEKQMEENIIDMDTICYQYDGNLNLISSTSSGVFEELQRLRDITNYKIVERDRKGNWTKRYLTRLHENRYTPSHIDEEEYKGQDEEVVEKSTDYTIELREIEYYADSQSVSSVSSDSQNVESSTSTAGSKSDSKSTIIAALVFYLFYFIFLVIVFLIVKLVITKIFRKEVSNKKLRKYFLIILAFPFVLIKSCDSCLGTKEDEPKPKSEKTQESYVRKFLAENEASTLVLPKFKVNSYEASTNAYDKWVIEFEEPIDKSKLITMETSEKSYLDRDVLCFPIEEKDEYNPIYDYRSFKLEILPDGKTAILLYSYHKIHPDISVSGGGSSHHWHHDD